MSQEICVGESDKGIDGWRIRSRPRNNECLSWNVNASFRVQVDSRHDGTFVIFPMVHSLA